MGATNYQTARQAGVRRIFARLAARGLLITVTLQMGALPGGAYDPTTNGDGPPGYAHTPTVPAFRYQATVAETALGISLGTEVLMIQGADLPAGAVPAERDGVLIGDDAWNITKVSAVPLELVYLLSIARA